MGFSGPQPITWQDIDAFLRRSEIALAPWQIELIERLDDIYLQPTAAPLALPEGRVVHAAASVNDPAGVRAVLGASAKRRYVKRKGG